MARATRMRWIIGGAAAFLAIAAAVSVTAVQAYIRDREHAAGGTIGTWGERGDDEPYVTFSIDGSFGGSDSCNGFGGRWREASEGVEVYETVMTLIACMDGRDQWLSGARTFRVDGEMLHAYDASGLELGSLPRRE